jgi:hypothetical protein
MSRMDIYKDAKNGFKQNPQNINKTGVNRKLISDVNIDLENNGVKEATKNDIVSCYLRLINLPVNELKQAVEDNKKPALIRIVGKAILSGKGFEVIEKVLDRAVGKANQAVDLNMQETARMQVVAMFPTEEELDAMTK